MIDDRMPSGNGNESPRSSTEDCHSCRAHSGGSLSAANAKTRQVPVRCSAVTVGLAHARRYATCGSAKTRRVGTRLEPLQRAWRRASPLQPDASGQAPSAAVKQTALGTVAEGVAVAVTSIVRFSVSSQHKRQVSPIRPARIPDPDGQLRDVVPYDPFIVRRIVAPDLGDVRDDITTGERGG